jgi:hypothetical protein
MLKTKHPAHLLGRMFLFAVEKLNSDKFSSSQDKEETVYRKNYPYIICL